MKYRVITNSERGAFACQKKWGFSYNERLTTLDAAAPLRQGSLYHRCLETLYRGIAGFEAGGDANPRPTRIDEICETVIDPWLEQREFFTRQNLDPEVASHTIERDREIADQTAGMVSNYIDRFISQDAERWEVLGVELQVARELPNPKTGKTLRIQRKKCLYGGAIDLLVRDRISGLVFLVEHKTTAERDLDRYCRKLHFDPQIRGYPWALAKPHPAADLKEPVEVAGIIYNVARKKLPAMPKILKSGKISTDKRIDTTHAVFLREVLIQGQNPADYVEILDQLKGREFFHRETYMITPGDLQDFQEDMSHNALQIRDASKPGTFHPRQVQVCTGPGSWPCPFNSICMEDGPMARASYRTKTVRHEELTGDLAEEEPNKKTENLFR